MTGISIDGIAAALPTGPTPPPGAGNGRFAGLIADLSARMKAGAPAADAPLPDGLTLPVDRQNLAGDDAAGAAPQDMADDDDADAMPIVLTAYIPVPVAAPGVALAPNWKMPVLAAAPRTIALPETAAIAPKTAEAPTPAPATPANATPPVMPTDTATAATAAPVITPLADPAAAPAKIALPAPAASQRPDAPIATPATPQTPSQPQPAVAVATPIAPQPIPTPAAAPTIAPPEAAPVAAPASQIPHHAAEGTAARPAPIAAIAPAQAAQAAPAIVANAAISLTPAEDRPATADSAVEPASTGGIAALAPAPAPAVHRAAAPAATQPAIDTGRAEWIEALVDRIDEMRGHGGHRETRIRLLPDALGAVDVRIQRDGDRVNVHFVTENPHARALLNEAAPRLVEMAESRGLKLGDTGVRHDNGQSQAGQSQAGQSQADQQRADQQRTESTRRAASRPAAANPDAAPDEPGERIA
ncbi:flagellar hook-length control protein FliK [Sphingomonas sp. SCN 67-18]|uniref:flagellar hook-length control protein FliK n=1 Tax=uncultured Sphingomonas sp. TaxID=158754 RepID=UPI0025E3407C|nr:flagellar hook-length control protein FliK [Sphingomonas sp. SCN 67-18]